jgi:hypothetical protein
VVAGFVVFGLSPPKRFEAGAAEVEGVNKPSDGLVVLFRLPKRDAIVMDWARRVEDAQGLRAATGGGSGRWNAVQLRIYFEDALMLIREAAGVRLGLRVASTTSDPYSVG